MNQAEAKKLIQKLGGIIVHTPGEHDYRLNPEGTLSARLNHSMNEKSIRKLAGNIQKDSCCECSLYFFQHGLTQISPR